MAINNPAPSKGSAPSFHRREWLVADVLENIGEELHTLASLVEGARGLEDCGLYGLPLLLGRLSIDATNTVKSYRPKSGEIPVPADVLELLVEAAEPRITRHWASVEEFPGMAPVEDRILERRAVVDARMAAAWKVAQGTNEKTVVLGSMFIEAMAVVLCAEVDA